MLGLGKYLNAVLKNCYRAEYALCVHHPYLKSVLSLHTHTHAKALPISYLISILVTISLLIILCSENAALGASCHPSPVCCGYKFHWKLIITLIRSLMFTKSPRKLGLLI